MKSIGVRELRQRASLYLGRVQAGETLQVTDRGRPVALIVPLPRTGPLATLEAQGRLSQVEGDLLDLGPPLAPAEGARRPSEILAEARRDER